MQMGQGYAPALAVSGDGRMLALSSYGASAQAVLLYKLSATGALEGPPVTLNCER